MSATEQTVKKLPGVLSFQRRHVITDALMFNEINDDFENYPLWVVRHGIRGTQNVNEGKSEASQGTASRGGTREISNIQLIDSAKLDPRATGLIVRFSLRFLDISQGLDACVAADQKEGDILRESLIKFTERAKSSKGLQEVALRYARNVVNGRWLWRNRTLASSINLTVNYNGNLIAQIENGLTVPLNQFDNYSEAEKKIADVFIHNLQGSSQQGIEVVARLQFGLNGIIEVFPSQNYIERKPDGFARSLYRVGKAEVIDRNQPIEFRIMGQAAIRDQKVFNAIRTIDTWYPSFSETGFPIAIEPMGASLAHQQFYRPKNASSFALFKRLNTIDPDSPEGMYCIAALDRGGVYSESDKEKTTGKNKDKTSSEGNDTDTSEIQ